MMKLNILNDYKSIFLRDPSGCFILTSSTIVTFVVKLNCSSEFGPLVNIAATVQYAGMRDNHKEIYADDLQLEYLDGCSTTLYPPDYITTFTFVCKRMKSGLMAKFIIYDSLIGSNIQPAETDYFFFLNSFARAPEISIDLAGVVAVAAASAAFASDSRALCHAFESFCNVRNWLDFSILSLGGISWSTLPIIPLPVISAYRKALAASSPMLTPLSGQQIAALNSLESIQTLYRQESLEGIVKFFEVSPSDMKEAVRRIVSLCDLVRKTVQNLLQQIGQGKSEAAYTVEMLTDRYVDGKAAFLYVENYFLRKPNLDFNLIAKDCFLCEEIGTLIDRSRPPKRAFKVSDLKSNRPGYAT